MGDGCLHTKVRGLNHTKPVTTHQTHAHANRVKRELSELKEAAEAAEAAMGQQAQELQRLRAEGKAKDERIKKLDAVKLTTEQVGKLKKIKEEHAHFSSQNKQLKQELETLKQRAAGQQAAEGT